MTRVGVISDTHGLLRPEAVAALDGCALIVHAGDVGAPKVLAALEAVAPVHAVRGNVDHGSWAGALPEALTLTVGVHRIHVLHDLSQLAPAPAGEVYDVVVTGHSHRPQIERRAGVLFVNPGSAGPRRFRLPIALAVLHAGAGTPRAELVDLE
jgi:putative phosphoesterase